MIQVERVKTFGSEKTEKCQLDKVSEVKWRLFEKILDNLVLGQPLHVDWWLLWLRHDDVIKMLNWSAIIVPVIYIRGASIKINEVSRTKDNTLLPLN